MFVITRRIVLNFSKNLLKPNIRSNLISVYKSYSTVKTTTKINKTIGFIGDGNMAKAIARICVNKGLLSYSQIIVSSPFFKNLEKWQDFGAKITTSNQQVTEEADVIILAVKPHILSEAIGSIENITPKMNNKLFISIIAGSTLKHLEKMSKFKGARIIRCMPNTPMMVGEGITVYCADKKVTNEDIELVDKMLSVSGVSEMVPETMINAIGALSGSGPAFAYVMIEALSDGAVKMGLHREMATKFAAQTVLGAAKMVLTADKHTGQLKDDVCSAGGTSIAGIHALEINGVRGGIMDAIEAAAKRAVELSEEKY